jgi:hypothetical protein
MSCIVFLSNPNLLNRIKLLSICSNYSLNHQPTYPVIESMLMLIFHVGNRKLLPLKQLYRLKEIFDKFRLMNHNIVIVLLMLHLSWLKSHS